MSITERATTDAKETNAKPSPVSAPPGDWVVSTKEIASWIGVTRQVIDDLSDRGAITRSARDRWPLKQTVRAAFAHYRATAAGRGPDNTGELVSQRARLARAQSEALERKNAHDAGKLLDIDEVIQHLGVCNRQVVSHLLALPSTHAVALATCNEPREVHVLLTRLLREALENLCSEFDVRRQSERQAQGRS